MYGSLLTSSCNEHVVRAPTHQCPLTRRQMDRPKAAVPEERWEIGGMDADNVNVEIEIIVGIFWIVRIFSISCCRWWALL